MKTEVMSRTFSLQCMLLSLCIVQSAFCEIIPADRKISWTGTVGVAGGIPQRSTIHARLAPGATAADINAAIAGCPDGQVVFLTAGTYKITDGPINLSRSNVTLRGAGSNLTRLVFSGFSGYACIGIFGGSPDGPSQFTGWTGGFAQGSTTVTVASSSGYSVGDLIGFDQLNDPAYVSSGTDGGNYTNDSSGSRLEMQLSEITAINGNQLSISPGIYMANWNPDFSPRMMRYCAAGQKVSNTGLEDLHIEGAAPAPAPSHNIALVKGENCWIKNIDGQNGNTDVVTVRDSKRCEVRDCYFRANRTIGVGSYSLLVQLNSQLLVENNVFDGGVTGVGALLLDNSTAGSVVGYNYIQHTSNSGWMGYISANHNAHPHFNLFEGNIAPQIYSDFVHGSASHNTLFRNWLRGIDTFGSPPAPCGTNTHCVTAEKYNRYLNIVGNVLGTPGFHAHYERSGTAITSNGDWWEDAIYKLGYQGTYDLTGYDSSVAATLLRHGNYDVVTAGVLWDDSISDHSLPTSMYRTTKPDWFGGLAWPPIDPAAGIPKSDAIIPAAQRFISENQPKPNAPTGLRVITP